MSEIDRLILGDNPFFGVSHMSEERGMAQSQRFQKNESILEVIDLAYSLGIRGFSFSTHDRAAQICDHIRSHPDRYSEMRIYPAVPYARKYALAVNEKGVLGAVKDVVMGGNRAGQALGMIARGGSAVLTQNPMQMMKLLIDAELKMFRDLRLGAVFLQNNVADLLLGLGFKDVFRAFHDYLQEKYETRAGFMSLNFSRMTEFLIDECGIERPLVCSAINVAGFQQSPSREDNEKTLREHNVDAMAMSVLAGGAVPPGQAFEYVTKLPNIKSILFGASTERSIRGTIEAVKAWAS